MANTYNSVTVQSTSATLVLVANTWRQGLTLYNNGSVTVYIGTDSSVTSSTGIPLLAGANYDFNGWGSYKGDLYGRAASATADVRYIEWTK